MGFIIYQIRPLEQNQIGLRRLRPLAFGGARGLFSKNLPTLIASGERWSLPAQALLNLAGIGDQESLGILFDLTPEKPDQLNLYQLISVSGRTASLITDALFHFKVACKGINVRDVTTPDEEFIVPDWRDSPDRYEQLRLEGGSRGGTWAWSEPPQSMNATIM